MDNVDLNGVELNPTEVVPEVKLPKHTQEDLDRIVKREKLDTEAKVRRELEEAHRAELAKLGQGATTAAVAPNMDVEKLYDGFAERQAQQQQQAQAEAAKAAHEAEMQRVADTYFEKLKKGGESYDDFDEIMGDFDHEAFPQLVFHTSGLENAADVMYELSRNPDKLERIDYWLNKSPKKGQQMLQSLAKSIDEARSAQSEYAPTNPPLSQVKPSNVGAAKGRQSLEDLKMDPDLMF